MAPGLLARLEGDSKRNFRWGINVDKNGSFQLYNLSLINVYKVRSWDKRINKHGGVCSRTVSKDRYLSYARDSR